MTSQTALTDLQIDKLIDLGAASVRACGEAIKTAWIALAPALISYLAWRQHANNKSRKEGQQTIAGKLDENTDITKKLAIQRGLVTNGKKPGEGVMMEFDLDLPGPAFETFNLSDGAPVMWKAEPCDDGKICRFVISGESRMGFHAHPVGERLNVVTGVLEIVTTKGKFHIGPGQEFFSLPDEIHSVGFCGYGDVIAHWPGQTTNELKIKIYQ